MLENGKGDLGQEFHTVRQLHFDRENMNDRIRHLKWVLVDQISDLTTGTSAIREHIETMNRENPPSEQWSICYFRMCTTFLIVSLSKLWEVMNHYGKEISEFPVDVRTDCISLKKEIERRKIYQFRSKYAAHIIDKDTNMPLSLSEGVKRYNEIVGEDVAALVAFCDWICPETYPGPSASVMLTVTRTRDHCLSVVGPCTERP